MHVFWDAQVVYTSCDALRGLIAARHYCRTVRFEKTTSTCPDVAKTRRVIETCPVSEYPGSAPDEDRETTGIPLESFTLATRCQLATATVSRSQHPLRHGLRDRLPTSAPAVPVSLRFSSTQNPFGIERAV